MMNKLTKENYFSPEMSKKYMGVSQYKHFLKCEAAAMAEINGEYKRPMTTALMVGSYIDAYFAGTIDEFVKEHPEIFKRDGNLKADYVQAELIIKRIEADPLFMEFMSGTKQEIMTAKLFGADWKIAIDSYHENDKIVDLKIIRSLERIMGKSFVEHWGYDLQMAIYSEVERKFKKRDQGLETYLAAATKEDVTDLELIHIPRWRRNDMLENVEKHMPRILAVKNGEVEPIGCGVCPYCRSVKKLTEPIDFELVGFNNIERKAILGES